MYKSRMCTLCHTSLLKKYSHTKPRMVNNSVSNSSIPNLVAERRDYFAGFQGKNELGLDIETERSTSDELEVTTYDDIAQTMSVYLQSSLSK